MITLDAARSAEVDKLLAGSVVDARLEFTSRLGTESLGEFAPSAGKITWDGSERRGRLDVDVVAASTMHPRHALANQGQALEARWSWPDIGVSVPCGRWLIAAPADRADQMLWQVAADPEGPARLARAAWWEPDGRVVTGSMAAQVGVMLDYARVDWAPVGSFGDHGAPDTECRPGASVLGDVRKVLDHAGVEIRPARRGGGVEIYQRFTTAPAAVWTWVAGALPVTTVQGTPAPESVPNRVTVWCEEDVLGVRTVRGWSEPLMDGPRRWDGPYGQLPKVVQLDGPASNDAMRTQAIQMLRQAQEAAGVVRIEMRADPRIETGDIARAVNFDDGTDCLCRVTSVALDAGSGLAVVEASVISGLVAGVPASTTI